MSSHDPTLTLEQIQEFIEEAEEYTRGETLETLLLTRMKLRAFERVMLCLGEAVKRLPMDLRAAYPAVDWKGAAGMRDWVAHGYDGLDYDVLWKAVAEKLPGLRTTAAQMLTDLGGPSPAEEMPG